MNGPEYSPGSMLWALWLSLWGAAAAYLQRVKATGPKSFSWWMFVIEIFTAMFIGAITYLLCDFHGIDPRLTAVLVGVNGFAGTKAIFAIRKGIKDVAP